jgi:PTH2 family peptidyl-tRNA hydrolase
VLYGVLKQAIVIRTDLQLGRGKMAVQVAHASVETFLKVPEKDKKQWLTDGQKKIVLKVKNEADLLFIFNRAQRAGLPTSLIRDAGLTQIPPGTKTAVGIGPAAEEKIDGITGDLPLL